MGVTNRFITLAVLVGRVEVEVGGLLDAVVEEAVVVFEGAIVVARLAMCLVS